jgi:hypothetical protein
VNYSDTMRAVEALEKQRGISSPPAAVSNGQNTTGGAVKAVNTPAGLTIHPWPKPLAEAAFHGIAGELVRAIKPHSEADEAALLTNFLVGAGNAIGRIPYAQVEGTRHHTNFFAVLVGETSKSRKGTSWGRIESAFYLVNSDWTSRIQPGGLSSGEGLIWAVRDPIEKEKTDKEGIQRTETLDEGVADKRLMIVEEEFASVLKIMAREGNSLSSVLRQAWDKGSLKTIVKNAPAKATGAHISIVGHISKMELLRYLNDIEAGNGFGNRFLWMCSKRARILPSGGGEVDYNELTPKLFNCLRQARTIGLVTRDAEADEAWEGIYPELSEGKLDSSALLRRGQRPKSCAFPSCTQCLTGPISLSFLTCKRQ